MPKLDGNGRKNYLSYLHCFMNLATRHISFAQLTDLAENRLAPAVRESSQQHLAACGICAGDWSRVSQVIGVMRADDSTDAPRDVLARAFGLFTRPAPVSVVRRLLAALSFDSAAHNTPAYGLRAGAPVAVRQLLYSAEGCEIDLRRACDEEGRTILSGQILGAECAGGTVSLIQGESVLASVMLDELCTFALPPVAPGVYDLRLQWADVEITIPFRESAE